MTEADKKCKCGNYNTLLLITPKGNAWRCFECLPRLVYSQTKEIISLQEENTELKLRYDSLKELNFPNIEQKKIYAVLFPVDYRAEALEVIEKHVIKKLGNKVLVFRNTEAEWGFEIK